MTTTSKPGEFRAVCKKGAWRPIEALTLEQRSAVDAGEIPSRWDHKLRAEVAAVPCTLDTTDREVFVAHMAEIHGVKAGHHMLGHRGYAARPTPAAMRKVWKGPKLSEDGQPFVSRDGGTETCPSCGLISELPQSHAAELWWREHLERCIGTERGAA